MVSNKLRVIVGAGLLALGIAGGKYFIEDFRNQHNSLCTPAIIDASIIKNRQYSTLSSSRHCIEDIGYQENLQNSIQKYYGCIDRAVEELTEITRDYEEHLSENNISDEQVTECEKFRNGTPYLVGSLVGAGSFFSVIGGLLGLVVAYRRRNDDE